MACVQCATKNIFKGRTVMVELALLVSSANVLLSEQPRMTQWTAAGFLVMSEYEKFSRSISSNNFIQVSDLMECTWMKVCLFVIQLCCD